MQSRLLVYEYGTKNRRWFRPIPDLQQRNRYAAYCAQHSAFPLGFLLLPCGFGQQKKVLICGQHLFLIMCQRVSLFHLLLSNRY